MTMKKTDLAKNKMIKASNAVKIASVPDRFGTGSGIPDRKEQRKLDQAAGLVPFACKLPMTLISHLHEQAKRDELSLNDLVAKLLNEGLGADASVTPKTAKKKSAKAE